MNGIQKKKSRIITRNSVVQITICRDVLKMQDVQGLAVEN